MDGTLYTTLVSGAVALGTVTFTQALTYIFSRKRDHEADWRKMKLEYYKEYVAAFTEATASEPDATVRKRYRSAVNNLNLVAPINILIALYAFQKEVAHAQDGKFTKNADSRFNLLLHAMRNDCDPKLRRDNSGFRFQHLNAHSEIANDNSVQ